MPECIKKCFWCSLFGHKYYRGVASWVCTKNCCRGKRDAIIAAPKMRTALDWLDHEKLVIPREQRRWRDFFDGS